MNDLPFLGNKPRIWAFRTFLCAGYSLLDIPLALQTQCASHVMCCLCQNLSYFLFTGSLSSVTWGWTNFTLCVPVVSIPYSFFSALVSYFWLDSCSFLAGLSYYWGVNTCIYASWSAKIYVLERTYFKGIKWRCILNKKIQSIHCIVMLFCLFHCLHILVVCDSAVVKLQHTSLFERDIRMKFGIIQGRFW